MIFECVVNVSEGRDERVLAELAASAAPALLDLHRDPDHHRAVLTLAGPADTVVPAARALAATVVSLLDLRAHEGAHPRLGVLDVVPFVPYQPGGPAPDDLTEAVVLRDEFARWLGAELGVPSFLYGPLPGGRTRTLPDIRRGVRSVISPPTSGPPGRPADRGDARSAPGGSWWPTTSGSPRPGGPPGGATRAGPPRARAGPDRRPTGPGVVQPFRPRAPRAGPALRRGREPGRRGRRAVEGAELVGLVPAVVLDVVARDRWAELGLSDDSTVESVLARTGA